MTHLRRRFAPADVAGAPAPTDTTDTAAESSGYKLPPSDIVTILDAKPTPSGILSPDRKTLLLADYEPYPSIAFLSRPFERLAGIRIDGQYQATRRTSQYTGITLLDVEDGSRRPLQGLPEGSRIGSISWAIDSSRFAFTRDTELGVELWVADAASASCRPLSGVHVTDILAGPYLWRDDSTTLMAVTVPPDRGPAPRRPNVPGGPVIEETAGKFTQAATYQDLLQNPFDARLFEHYATTQLAQVDIVTGKVTPLGKPDLFLGAALSPDENYLLVSRLKRPFSYRVPYFYFARTVEVWEMATGRAVYTVADLPVSDEVPRQGVPTGPRAVLWQAKKPATLLWAEALDNGDPIAKVPHRDRIMTLSAPFDAEPREVLRLQHRYAGWDWTDREDEVLLAEYDRDRRWHTTYFIDLKDPDVSKRTLFDLSVNDAYNDPGSPVYTVKPDGERVMLQDGDFVYFSGRGATPEGDRPFLDRRNLRTGETERLFRCGDEGYETFLAFPYADRRDIILTTYQDTKQPGNFYRHDLTTRQRTALTNFPDPHPQITGLTKELITYTREADGVPLSGTLYLPPGYDPASGEKLPLVIWAYPLEYSDASTAGQVRGSVKTFTRLAGTSPLWFVTQGYAVLYDATMPVVGDPETMNDTFVEQIVGAAKAAIDVLDARGIIDRNRVLVSGHSYGAFMTANLLAHSDLFAAGIARSGAYNRTLTPFGFQSERRSYWEARDIYHNVSPFTYANQIKKPILLIHGQADNNPGTYTVQSERFFQALQANGATARLVLLPYESHGYQARESVLHVLAEMFEWADKYVKNRPVSGE